MFDRKSNKYGVLEIVRNFHALSTLVHAGASLDMRKETEYLPLGNPREWPWPK